jgi:hypothetical protein
MTRKLLRRKPIITNASIDAGLTLLVPLPMMKVPYQRTASMRIAYLDCFSCISGDMFLGALVDAGVSVELLRGRSKRECRST